MSHNVSYSRPVYLLNDHTSPVEFLDSQVHYTNDIRSRKGFNTDIYPDPLALVFGIAHIPQEYMSLFRVLGSGAYGTAYLGSSLLGEDFHEHLYQHLEYRIGQPLCKLSGTVVKVAHVVRNDDVDAFVTESKTQALIAEESYKGLQGRDIVPNMCYAGILFARGNAVSIQVMSQAPGQTLYSLGEQQDGLRPDQFAAVEKAFVTLWMLGFMHGDAHGNNILIDRNNKVRIIDMGMALVLPFAMRDAVRRMDPSKIPGAEIFEKLIDSLSRDSIEDYNNDGKCLRSFEAWVRSDQPDAIAIARKAAWKDFAN